MVRFSQSIERFHTVASESRGLEDFGDDGYHEALGVLCRSLDEDTTLTSTGQLALEFMITDALEARLLCEEGWKCAPEASEAIVEQPLVITGLPRSGTTALHHLIAQDPAWQALEHWLQRTPKPRPPRAAWDEDADYRNAVERVRAMYERSPDMRAIHEIEADLPDECWNLFSQDFAHSGYQANADVRQYAAWWADCDMKPVYRRHRRNVQLIGHREPGKRWLFKDATHLFDPEALLSVYPDARIVQTHRDPVKSMASVCSLCWAARNALNEETDAHAFGRSTLDLWERSIYAMMDARERSDPAQFYDLPFERFAADPIAAIQDIYAHFGIEYTDTGDTAIRHFRSDHPKDKHGAHRYTLEQWGLDAGEIAERFQRYSDAYGHVGAAVGSPARP